MKAKHAACLIWRRFSNLFETIQSLFWAVFGLVSLTDFELAGKSLASPHSFYSQGIIFRNKRIHKILGPLDVRYLQLLQHHRASEHAHRYDVQLLPINLRQ